MIYVVIYLLIGLVFTFAVRIGEGERMHAGDWAFGILCGVPCLIIACLADVFNIEL